ncbi:hypothetical protein OSB04_025951 [Centaurea solstitialis]|uniref:START domain-containing protein n=1 Tax=Centaurea solstitialis TaxID=347529 RepID=A0AA38WDK6_9ASTR|nr:hypothetical protein OSB04_025951 [Centaurea solstitialis]
MLLLLLLLSIAFLFGITVGWGWKPTWVTKFAIKNISSNQTHQQQLAGTTTIIMDKQLQPSMDNPSCSSAVVKKDEINLLTDADLKHLWHLVEKRDGGPPWKHMMDRSTDTMTYQAWQRDPESGPPQYCSRTVYEGATPESLRDFFWDDDLRLKWDDMLLHATTLEEFPDVGASVVHWIRRFPFFCSDREYTIGRRMWELEGSFYCVTKGVSCTLVPRKQKPRRVDVYYSSWFIRTVGSKKGNNQPASEVVFFHHEDMGIPWEIAKFAISQGMWGTARKIERSFRWYQNERNCSKTTSPHIAMAEMSTKIDQNYLARLESDEDQDVPETKMVAQQEKPGGINLPKLLVIGGAVILACSLDRGLLTKAVIFKVARRFGNVGRRAFPPTQL